MNIRAEQIEPVVGSERVHKITTAGGDSYAVRPVLSRRPKSHEKVSDIPTLFRHLRIMRYCGISVPDHRHEPSVQGLKLPNSPGGWLLTKWVEHVDPDSLSPDERVTAAVRAVEGSAEYIRRCRDRGVILSDVLFQSQWSLTRDEQGLPQLSMNDIDPLTNNLKTDDDLRHFRGQLAGMTNDFEAWLHVPPLSVEQAARGALSSLAA